MKYKIGDIAYLLDLSTQSLRHYEQLGIVRPQKDAATSYRYYTAWDLIGLWACRHYRAFGFALEDSAKQLQLEPEDALRNLAEREREIEAEIERQRRMLETLRAWRAEAEASFALIGRFVLERNVPTLCLPYQQGDSLERNPERLALLREWMRFIPYVYVGMRIPWARGEADMARCTVSLCMAEVAAPILNPPMPPDVRRLEARECLHTAFRFERPSFDPHALCADMRRALEERGLTADGDLRCRFNVTTWRAGRIGGVLDCFLPVISA